MWLAVNCHTLPCWISRDASRLLVDPSQPLPCCSTSASLLVTTEPWNPEADYNRATPQKQIDHKKIKKLKTTNYASRDPGPRIAKMIINILFVFPYILKNRGQHSKVAALCSGTRQQHQHARSKTPTCNSSYTWSKNPRASLSGEKQQRHRMGKPLAAKPQSKAAFDALRP